MTVLVAEEQAKVDRDGDVLEVVEVPASPDGGFAFPGRPSGLAAAPDGTFLVSDATAGTIWRVGDGGASPVAGVASGIPDPAGGRMRGPAGLAVAPNGTILVADTSGHRIWAVYPTGSLRLVAGSASGYRDGPSTEALFRFPAGVAIGPDGTCYVADTGNDLVASQRWCKRPRTQAPM